MNILVVLDIRGKALTFTLSSMMPAVGLSYIALIMLRYVPSIPAFWRVFYFLFYLKKFFDYDNDTFTESTSFLLRDFCPQ